MGAQEAVQRGPIKAVEGAEKGKTLSQHLAVQVPPLSVNNSNRWESLAML